MEVFVFVNTISFRVIVAVPEAAVLFMIAASIVRLFPLPSRSPEKSNSEADICFPFVSIISFAFTSSVRRLFSAPTLPLRVTVDAVRVRFSLESELPLIIS